MWKVFENRDKATRSISAQKIEYLNDFKNQYSGHKNNKIIYIYHSLRKPKSNKKEQYRKTRLSGRLSRTVLGKERGKRSFFSLIRLS